MWGFICEHAIEIVMSLITAGALGACKYFSKQVKNYQKLLDEKEAYESEKIIERKLEPVYQELEDLRVFIGRQEEIESERMQLIIASYRFRLIQLCKSFMDKGSITQNEYDQLTELYKLYKGLGGNGQAKEYYDRAIELPIRHDN